MSPVEIDRTASLSLAEFTALVRRAGLSLEAERIAALHAQWPHVAAMLARVRGAERERAAEPATIFVPVGE